MSRHSSNPPSARHPIITMLTSTQSLPSSEEAKFYRALWYRTNLVVSMSLDSSRVSIGGGIAHRLMPLRIVSLIICRLRREKKVNRERKSSNKIRRK